MGRGFKTQLSTYSIGFAHTSPAKCRLCKGGVDKGEIRIVTCAFVMPGRRHDFVSHAKCVTPALVRAMLSVYGAVDRVPTKGIGGVACERVRTQLENVLSSKV